MRTAYFGAGAGGGGSTSFAPIQNIRYLDERFIGTSDGSIAKPYTLFSQFFAEFATDPGAAGESWELILPGLYISPDSSFLDVNASGTFAFRGVSPQTPTLNGSQIDSLTIDNQSQNISFTFSDLIFPGPGQLQIGDGQIDLVFVNCSVFIAVSTGLALNGTVRIVNSHFSNAAFGGIGTSGGPTLEMYGGDISGQASFSTAKFFSVQFGDGSSVYPGAGTTYFIGCLFEGGVTISNADSPTIIMDSASYASFIASGGAFAGTIQLPTNTDQIDNASGVPGTTASDALDTLAAAIALIPPAPVSSVFGRVGAVTALAGDYTATKITNDSGVSGGTVKDALNTLAAAIPAVPVSSVFGRVGAITALAGDYTASKITNDSGVSGATVKDALDTVNTLAAAATPATLTLTTTSPLRIDGGNSANLSANRTFSVSPVSNTTAGIAPQHAGAADVGKALIATATASGWGTDFGAQNLTTTGFISLGSSPALSGTIRLGSTGNIVFRETSNDRVALYWDVTYGVTLGNGSTLSAIAASSQVNLFVNGIGSTTALTVTTSSVSIQSIPVLQFGAGATNPIFRQAATSGLTGQLLTTNSQDSTAIGGTGGARLDRAGDATGASGTRTGGAYSIRPGAGATAGGELALMTGAAVKRLRIDDAGMSFFNVATVARQNITGSRGGNAALGDLLTKLALTGLITDGTSA